MRRGPMPEMERVARDAAGGAALGADMASR